MVSSCPFFPQIQEKIAAAKESAAHAAIQVNSLDPKFLSPKRSELRKIFFQRSEAAAQVASAVQKSAIASAAAVASATAAAAGHSAGSNPWANGRYATVNPWG